MKGELERIPKLFRWMIEKRHRAGTEEGPLLRTSREWSALPVYYEHQLPSAGQAGYGQQLQLRADKSPEEIASALCDAARDPSTAVDGSDCSAAGRTKNERSLL